MSIVAACYVLYSLGVLVAPAASEAVRWARTNLHIVQHVPLAMAVVILLIHGMGQAQRLRGSIAALRRREAPRRRPATDGDRGRDRRALEAV